MAQDDTINSDAWATGCVLRVGGLAFRVVRNAPSVTGLNVRQRPMVVRATLILYGKAFDLKLSDNKVYCIACFLPVMFQKLCCALHCPKVLD